MARNQSSEFRRSHEKTRILVKDYSKDFYLDFEPVRRSIINPSQKRGIRAHFQSRFLLKILFAASLNYRLFLAVGKS